MSQPLTKKSAATGLITVAEFEAGHPVRHFFGTRHWNSGQRSLLDGTAYSGPGFWKARAIVSVKQVHGADALVVDRPIEAGTTFAGGWDAVITNQPELLVTVRTADCVPILLHDPIHHVVAAVHSGWRGSVAGIVPKTLTTMQQQFGSQASAIQMAIGPSAGRCCYEVDEPVLKPLQSYPFWTSVVRETGSGRALLDLREFVRRQAQAAGVPDQNIWTVSHCTICEPDLFFRTAGKG